jgi:hypothetical protein
MAAAEVAAIPERTLIAATSAARRSHAARTMVDSELKDERAVIFAAPI